MPNLILILGLAAILITGTVALDQIAFADDDDHDKECKEDLEDFIKKTNKLIDKKKLSEEQGQSLIGSVEKLIENGYGVRAAFRKAVEALGESTAGGVNKQYYVMKKRALENNLRNTDIINIHGLKIPLEKLLIKAGIMQEESIWG